MPEPIMQKVKGDAVDINLAVWEGTGQTDYVRPRHHRKLSLLGCAGKRFSTRFPADCNGLARKRSIGQTYQGLFA